MPGLPAADETPPGLGWRLRVGLGILLVGLVVWLALEAFRSPAPPPAIAVVLATSPVVYSGLIAVAEDQGYFKDAGVAVAIREYSSGRDALAALSAGEVHLATAADFAFLSRRLDDSSLKILSSLSSSDTHEVVARPDRGVSRPGDLKGKRIGFSVDTSSEYYLMRFLLFNAIAPAEVTPVNLSPENIAKALADDRVDAIVTWEKYVHEADRLLPGRTISWSAQDNLDFYWVLAAKEDVAESEAGKRVIAALARAEEFVILHEGQARDILVRRWRFDPIFMNRFWSRTRLSLTLDQALVIGLEDAAAWKRRSFGDGSQAIPDVLDYISFAAMDQVAPHAVTIFR